MTGLEGSTQRHWQRGLAVLVFLLRQPYVYLVESGEFSPVQRDSRAFRAAHRLLGRCTWLVRSGFVAVAASYTGLFFWLLRAWTTAPFAIGMAVIATIAVMRLVRATAPELASTPQRDAIARQLWRWALWRTLPAQPASEVCAPWLWAWVGEAWLEAHGVDTACFAAVGEHANQSVREIITATQLLAV